MRASCVSSQRLRRDSSGCAESGMEAADVVTDGPTPWRRVSCRPGAEGAPRDFGDRCECEVEWPLGGAMRIACGGRLDGVEVRGKVVWSWALWNSEARGGAYHLV